MYGQFLCIKFPFVFSTLSLAVDCVLCLASRLLLSLGECERPVKLSEGAPVLYIYFVTPYSTLRFYVLTSESFFGAARFLLTTFRPRNSHVCQVCSLTVAF
jgi:hypothetical protein